MVRRPRVCDKWENLVKTLPLRRLAAAAVTGTLLLASSAFGADEKKDQKPAPKPAPSKPAPSQSSPFTPPSRPAPPPANNGQHKETVQSATNRMRSNPFEVNTSSRTAPFVGAAQGGAKRDLDRMTRTGGSTQVFDGGRGSTLNTGVRPNPVQVSSSTARTTPQPSTSPMPRSRPTPPPPPPSSNTSSSSP